DKILRRVWGFDVKEQAYENYQAGQDSVLTGIAVFVKKWHSGTGKDNNGILQMKSVLLILMVYSPYTMDKFIQTIFYIEDGCWFEKD
ncbi:hypothetical protein ACSLPI_26555, partial [Escherichia coli]